MFASTALFLFIERSSDDLLVEVRDADARNLRSEAYSSLETVVAVLKEFKEVNGTLKSPAEGWGDPLVWASYEPSEGCAVRVEFVDESGKISLPHATQNSLVELFKSWEILKPDAERLADALLHWMKHDYLPASTFTPTYELDSLVCEPPGRSLRSWGELASIDVVRDVFFDDDGRPNALWNRLVECVSLFDFAQTNINSPAAGVLTSLGVDMSQQTRLLDYLSGTGEFKTRGPGFFRTTGEFSQIVNADLSGGTYGTDIQALRVIITVQKGRSLFRLNVVLSPSGSGGAKYVDTKATPETAKAVSEGTTTKQTKSAITRSTKADASGSTAKKSAKSERAPLNYPFAVLEIRENDEISQPVADPSVTQ